MLSTTHPEAPPHDLRASEEGSVILALLVSIIVAGLMTVIVATVVTGQRSVRFDQDFTRAVHVAEHGVAEVLFDLNSGLLQATDLDANNEKTGSGVLDDGTRYDYTVEWDGERGWTVTSTGGAVDGVKRTVEVLLEERPLFHLAAFSDRVLDFAGNNMADSYNSNTGEWCTKKGRVGSNFTLEFSGVANTNACHDGSDARTVDGVDLFDWEANPGWPDNPGNERCIHSGGGGGPNNCLTADGQPWFVTHDEYRELHLGDDDDPDPKPYSVAHLQGLIDECKASGQFQTLIRASEFGGSIPPATAADGPKMFPTEDDSPHYWCAGKVIFDTHTTLPGASADNPVIFVVEESIVVQRDLPGPPSQPRVHCVEDACKSPGPGGPAPVAAALQVYTPSDDNPEDGQGRVFRVRQQSVFAGAVWAPRGTCGGGANVHIYGSLFCKDIPNVGGWEFHFDEALLDIGLNVYDVAAWSEQQ